MLLLDFKKTEKTVINHIKQTTNNKQQTTNNKQQKLWQNLLNSELIMQKH